MYPILISLGPLKIYSFGVFLVLALVLGSFIVWREGRQAKPDRFDENRLLDLILVEAISGLAGARAYYLALHLKEFGFVPFHWLLIFHFPGLSFIGAIIGGLVGLLVFAKKMKWSVYQVGDFLVLGVSLGEAIGRIGAFLSGSSFGTPTSLPWGVSMIGLVGRRHPVQIYESLAAFLIFIVLIKLQKFWQQRSLPSGGVFLFYFLLLGISRFLLEFFRGDCVYYMDWRTTQIASLIFISGSFILLYRRLGRSLKNDLLIIVCRLKTQISKRKTF